MEGHREGRRGTLGDSEGGTKRHHIPAAPPEAGTAPPPALRALPAPGVSGGSHPGAIPLWGLHLRGVPINLKGGPIPGGPTRGGSPSPGVPERGSQSRPALPILRAPMCGGGGSPLTAPPPPAPLRPGAGFPTAGPHPPTPGPPPRSRPARGSPRGPPGSPSAPHQCRCPGPAAGSRPLRSAPPRQDGGRSRCHPPPPPCARKATPPTLSHWSVPPGAALPLVVASRHRPPPPSPPHPTRGLGGRALAGHAPFPAAGPRMRKATPSTRSRDTARRARPRRRPRGDTGLESAESGGL